MTFVFATFTSFRYISKSFLVNSLQLVPFRQWQTPCSRLEKRLLGIVITLGLHSPFQWHDFVWSDCINICEYVISLHWNPMRTNERGKDHLMTAVISVDFSRGRNIDFWDSLTSSHTCRRSFSLSLFCTQCALKSTIKFDFISGIVDFQLLRWFDCATIDKHKL